MGRLSFYFGVIETPLRSFVTGTRGFENFSHVHRFPVTDCCLVGPKSSCHGGNILRTVWLNQERVKNVQYDP